MFRDTNRMAATTTQIINDIDMETVDFPVWVPCANGGSGEFIKQVGIVRQIIMLTVNGNRFAAKLQYTPLGLQLTGMITGDKYNAAGVNRFVETGSFLNDSYVFTNINNFHVIGAGPNTVKSKFQQQVRVRINVDGTVVTSIDKITASCQ